MGVYTESNHYRSGKQIKEDFKAGATIRVFQPGPFGPAVKDGPEVIEGPQNSPRGHSFYVGCTVKDGVVVAIKGVKRDVQ